MTNFENTVLMVNGAAGRIAIDKHPDFDDMVLIFDGVETEATYTLEPGKQVHVGSTYVNDMGVILTYAGDGRFMELGMGGDPDEAPKVYSVITDDESDGNGPLRYQVSDQTPVSMTIAFRDKGKDDFKNTVLMVNQAKASINIDRDPNFDDMLLIFNGNTTTDSYTLEPGQQVHVGSTYGNDMGVCLTYGGDQRYMELGINPDPDTKPTVFAVISDSEDDGGGPLATTVADQTPTSMTMTLRDKA
jgi:hypothetical protein